MSRLYRYFLGLLSLHLVIALVLSDGLDDKMRNLAHDIGNSLTSISSAHNHRVDWMFIVDHGGFTAKGLHLQYSKYFIQQLASHLYISPMNSQVGVITYGATANLQIPLNVQEGNQCEFNKNVNKLTLTVGQSNMNQGLQKAINELRTKGRDSTHKVMILITSAGWGNIGDNPYDNVDEAKKLGTLIVVVLVFDRTQSIVAPVILNFASQRNVIAKVHSGSTAVQSKYAFEIEAHRGHLRRLYRHFLLAVEEMPYRPLQVPSRHCPTCQVREACVCDVNLYNTYHCEQDSYEPLITVGCPADIARATEAGKPSATVVWRSAQAVDYSSSMQAKVVLEPNGIPKVRSNVVSVNATHKSNPFPIGKTRVTHAFSDAGGNSINCSFTVTVTDKETPNITNCPASDISDNATSLMATKRVYWPTVVAKDNSLSTPTSDLYINDVLTSSGLRYFAIGTSNVRVDFTDQSGNFATCRFNVIVKDYEPPLVQQCTGPNSTIFSSDSQTYVSWPQPEFVDNSGSAVSITSDKKAGYFRIGQHTITYTATDTYNNSKSCAFTFNVRGYPCPKLSPPVNGAIICDNMVPGATCQMFCQNPFDFESIPGAPKLPEKYSCIGTGVWWPTDEVPHCAVNQGAFKKLPQTYYYDGNCSSYAVKELIKVNAAEHYQGFVEGGYFKEAWGRTINVTDFTDPVCGAAAMITTSTSTVRPPTTTPPTTRLTTTTFRRSYPTASTMLPPSTTSTLPPPSTKNVNVIVG